MWVKPASITGGPISGQWPKPEMPSPLAPPKANESFSVITLRSTPLFLSLMASTLG